VLPWTYGVPAKGCDAMRCDAMYASLTADLEQDRPQQAFSVPWAALRKGTAALRCGYRLLGLITDLHLDCPPEQVRKARASVTMGLRQPMQPLQHSHSEPQSIPDCMT
jgi:hypothetical protein